MSYTINPSTPTARLNPYATLGVCDECGEHAPSFRAGTQRLCPLCAVNTDLTTIPEPDATALSAALIQWITTPDELLDVSDDEFYSRMDNGRAWSQHKIDLEAERRARKRWVESVCEVAA